MINFQLPLARPISPIMLADQLISLAQEADRAGYSGSASLLVTAAFAVLDEAPHGRH